LRLKQQIDVSGERTMHSNAVYALETFGGAIDRCDNIACQPIAQDLPECGDLEVAFSRMWEQISGEGQMEFRFISEGQPKTLHPPIREEAYRIVREALLNAFRHSHARSVELEVHYAPIGLRVAVRDDGTGMTHQSLRYESDDYRGLSMIQTRAEEIGAKLKLSSGVGLGTEVELTIPSHLAFELGTKPRKFRWLPI
jgi:nitrate/nitrite-specific signal transduction histidine kinase